MRHRRLPTLGRHVRRGLTQAAALTAVAGLVVVGGAGAARVGDDPAPTDGGATVAGVPLPDATSRLMRRFECSTTGYADGSTPQSAIVRGRDGRVRVVSFDRGWAVHTAAATRAELVAVCLRPAP